MAEPSPEQTPTFEETLKTAFREVAKREIESGGTFKADEVSDFINALADWHVTQSIIEAQKTLLKNNQETIEDLRKKFQEKTITQSDLDLLERLEQSMDDQLYQLRSYEEQAETYQESLQKTIESISLDNEALKEKLWSLSDHLSAFARDIYKRATPKE